MKLVRLKEYLYIKKNLSTIQGLSIDSKNAGILRLFMVPPSKQWDRTIPYILIINGQKMLPVGVSWAVMLHRLMKRMQEYGSLVIDKDNYEIIIEEALLDTKVIYPAMHMKELRKEMKTFLDELRHQETMVPVHAFHPIRSEKIYAESFKKAGNEIWQYPDSTIAKSQSYKVEKINGMRKEGSEK